MGRFDVAMSMDDRSESDDAWSEYGRQSDAAHVTEIYKDYDLYLSTRNGNLDDFKRLLEKASAGETLSRLSPAGNTYLHVAVKHGHEDIATFIAAKEPSLMSCKNFYGETALHLAAKAGNAAMVRELVRVYRDWPENQREEMNILRQIDARESTALDLALIERHDSVAEYLIMEDPELGYCKTKNGESALFLAAKEGFANCVSLILQVSTDEESVVEVFKTKSPIGAAIKWKHRDVLEAILSKKPSLIELEDLQGRTPLHYAVALGSLDDVRYLLSQCTANANRRDKSGSLPIHLATAVGHIDVVRFLLQDFPDPAELVDSIGRNVLHIAAVNGRSDIVKFVLASPDLASLINTRDRFGNTPLHLATMSRQPKIVYALTWDKRVNIKVFNDMGLSALDDVSYNNISVNPPFSERLIWAVLKAAGTPRYRTGKTVRRKQSLDPNSYKERVNTLLLVATLVATVTFTAGFTVPGGYNSSPDKNLGMATMLSEKGFQVFVFCDTIAMYTSILVVVTLIWAQLGDVALVLNALNFALPSLGIALSMMSMAFTAGLLIVISEIRWLATAVLIMGVAFIVIFFNLFLPLCSPLTSTNRVLRHLSYYPFCLLMLVIDVQPTPIPDFRYFRQSAYI